MTQAFIFDVDGTLIDSVLPHARAWQETLKHFGIDVSVEAMRQQIGKGSDKIIAFASPSFEPSRYEEISKFRTEHFKKYHLPKVRGFPHVRALFEQLQKDGKRIALGSSAMPEELSIYKQIAGIETMSLEEASSSDAAHSKPDPDIFQAARQKLGVPAEDCTVVGDSTYDMEAAQRAGMHRLGVLSGGFSEKSLRDAGAFRVYNDVGELLRAYLGGEVQ